MKEKSKRKVFLGIAALIMLTVSGYIFAQQYGSGVQNITSTVNTARYIMFGGAYNVKGADNVENSVFKLDTYTGDTWMLNVVLDANGNKTKIWIPVDSKAKKTIPVNPENARMKELLNNQN